MKRRTVGYEYYIPGLPADYVAQRYGIALGDIAKLGSAENPLGASPLAKAAVADALDHIHQYPSWTAEPLRQKIASSYGYEPSNVICGAGETEIISLIVRAYCEPGRQDPDALSVFPDLPSLRGGRRP